MRAFLLGRRLPVLIVLILSYATPVRAEDARRPSPPPQPAARSGQGGIWIDRRELQRLPVTGPAWENLVTAAAAPCGSPDLSNQDDDVNICVLAKALVSARTGDSTYQQQVRAAVRAIVAAEAYRGRALALGRELAAYVVAADLIELERTDPELDAAFRSRIRALLTTPTSGGPRNLIECHEKRPNNWGTHCGASRAAVLAYLGDVAGLARVAQVFKGWLGDRDSYDAFTYGSRWWQCHPDRPVGINPRGCSRNGHSIDGVLPDEQRRAGPFAWPPPKENYTYGGLSGALATAVVLQRAGYADVFEWQDQALLRAFRWLYDQAHFPAAGDDEWQPHIVNAAYRADFPAAIPAAPGKHMAWTDWTHGSRLPSGAVEQ